MAWLGVLLLFAVFGLAGPYKMVTRDRGGAGHTGGGGPPVVHMAGLAFSPGSLVVPRGTEVSFVNDDVAPHTVSAEDGSVDSGILRPGADAFRLVVNQRFSYYCAVHTFMKATVDISG
jgi:plastocyanin